MNNKNIILFDGVCNFCNYWVNFVIQRDKKDSFRFAALQSVAAKQLIRKFSIEVSTADTFILIADGNIYIKSIAALMVCKKLNGPIKFLYLFIVLPEFFLDFIYDLVAKNRYRLFGKRDSCRIPTKEEKEKFLN